MGIALTSDSKQYDTLDLSNYAQLNIVNDLSRVAGVSGVRIFGQRQYAMRIWLNPRLLGSAGLDASDVVSALQEQNVEIGAGSIGAPPAPKNQPYTYTVNAVTQLSDPGRVREHHPALEPQRRLHAPRRRRARRAGRAGLHERAALRRTVASRRPRRSAVFHRQRARRFESGHGADGAAREIVPARRALQGRLQHDDVRARVDQRSADHAAAFDPPGRARHLRLPAESESTLIPAATIPVSLVGTFFVMKIFGFSINTITLFGLTLATGLVVDDAIVVIENIARHIEMNRGKKSPLASAAEAMREIQSAVVASSLVLLAVFIPVGFFPGTTGQLYKQFALTIAAAITISLFQALTLAPVLSARLLGEESESKFVFFRWFNHGLKRFRDWYARQLPKAFRYRWWVAGAFALALAFTGLLFVTTPQAFIPDEDQGYFIMLRADAGGHVARRRAGDRDKGRSDRSCSNPRSRTCSTSAASASAARRRTAA